MKWPWQRDKVSERDAEMAVLEAKKLKARAHKQTRQVSDAIRAAQKQADKLSAEVERAMRLRET